MTQLYVKGLVGSAMVRDSIKVEFFPPLTTSHLNCSQKLYNKTKMQANNKDNKYSATNKIEKSKLDK